MLKKLLCFLFGHQTISQVPVKSVGAFRETVYEYKQYPFCLRCGDSTTKPINKK